MQRRADFPFLSQDGNYIYLDSAASTQKPKVVLDIMHDFYSHSYAPVHRSIYRKAMMATEKYESVRNKVKEFIHADFAEEIIFTRGTTDSLNLVARSFGKAFLKKNDVVMISAIEHHSNIVPWQILAEERGIVLEIIPVDKRGDIILEELEKRLNSQVKVVALAHISNVIGTIHPIKKITEMTHKVGAIVVVDGAQGTAHLPLNVKEMDVDFYAFSSHKMYGPTGVGILYGKKEILEKMPPISGGGDMIEKVTFKKTTFAPPPLRFEAGTPMIGEVMGLGAAIDYMNEIGLKNIKSYEDDLLAYAENALQKVKNVKILGSPNNRSAILTFIIEDLHPLDVATFLDLKNIALRSGHHCSQPTMELFGIEAALRISFGIYNTFDEIDRFILALEEVCFSLRKATLC